MANPRTRHYQTLLTESYNYAFKRFTITPTKIAESFIYLRNGVNIAFESRLEVVKHLVH